MMCDINAFVLKNGEEVKIMENVETVKRDGNQIQLLNIFGEQERINGRMLFYNNSKKKMVFEEG